MSQKCIHDFTSMESMHPQNSMSCCCRARASERVVSLQDDRLRPCKPIPSMSDAIPYLLKSVPELARRKSAPNMFLNCNFFFAVQLHIPRCFRFDMQSWLHLGYWTIRIIGISRDKSGYIRISSIIRISLGPSWG